MEHCISSFKNKTEYEIYKIYVTDSLKAIVNMYNKTHGGTGEVIEKRYYDIINPPRPRKEETAEEIISRIKSKLGG